jgi:hypothetical protein
MYQVLVLFDTITILNTIIHNNSYQSPTTTMSTLTPTETPASTTASSLRSLIYENVNGKPTLQVLDQLLIPAEKTYIPVPNLQTTWSVIRKMQIRGT